MARAVLFFKVRAYFCLQSVRVTVRFLPPSKLQRQLRAWLTATTRAALRNASSAAKSAAPEPYLTPQFGASFCVSTRYYAAATAAVGMLFG